MLPFELKDYEDYINTSKRIDRKLIQMQKDVERNRLMFQDRLFNLAIESGIIDSDGQPINSIVEIVKDGEVVETIPVHLPGVSHILILLP